MTITDQIEKLWTDFLGFLSTLIIPDWAGLIALLPLFLLIGVVGPILSIVLLAWLGYGITKPRTKVSYVEGVRTAPLDYLGEPIFPAGEPYCPRRRLHLSVRDDALRPRQDAAVGSVPEMRARPRGEHRHLRQLRPRPEDRAADPDRRHRRSASGRRGRRVTSETP